MTAGHCIYDGDTVNGGQPAVSRSVELYISNNSSYSQQMCNGIEITLQQGWFDTVNSGEFDRRFDWGVIRMDCNAGYEAKYLDYVSTEDSSFIGERITVSGYPGDKPSGTLWGMVTTIGTDFTTTMFNHTADTTGGQSGSPIWFPSIDFNNCKTPCLMGIHIATDGIANQGKRISPDMYAILDQISSIIYKYKVHLPTLYR